METFVKRPSYKREQGFVLASVCILLALMFTLAAVAIDAGNMYLWRLRLEKAARAGVISGLGYRALRGWQPIYGGPPEYESNTNPKKKTSANSTGIRDLHERVKNVIRENFRASFNDQEAADKALERLDFNGKNGDALDSGIEVSAYNPIDDSIEITVSYLMPTTLVGRLYGMGVNLGCNTSQDSDVPNSDSQDTYERSALCRVKTTQRAQLAPATIAMVLDTSGSMICEDGDPTCSCRTNAAVPCGTGAGFERQIITRLKKAAYEFHTYFNPFRDKIAVIPFNLAARVARPIVRNGCDGNGRRPLPFGNTQLAYRAFVASILGGYPKTFANDLDIQQSNLDPVLTSANDCDAGTNEVLGLEPMSNTNPCDGLIQAGLELSQVRDLSGEFFRPGDQGSMRHSVVFFTDGAPNAMRAAYTSPLSLAGGQGANRLDATANSSSASSCSGSNSILCNDWYQYSVEWRDAASATVYRGPGPLVHSIAGKDLFNFQISVDKVTAEDGTVTYTPATYPAQPKFSITPPVCGDNRFLPMDFERVLTGNNTDDCLQDSDGVLRLPDGSRCGCLQNVDFALPRLSEIREGRYTPAVKGVATIQYFTNAANQPVVISGAEQLPYYCAVEAADWLRVNLGAQVFSIGLGEPANWCEDPLQDADNHFKRKDFFLSRLAYSPLSTAQNGRNWDPKHDLSKRNITVSTAAECQDHRFNAANIVAGSMEVGYEGGRAPNEFPEETRGQVYLTESSTQLTRIFVQTAKQILLRLGS